MFVLESTEPSSSQPTSHFIVDTLAHFIAKGYRKRFYVLSPEFLIEFSLQRPELEFYSDVKKVFKLIHMSSYICELLIYH